MPNGKDYILFYLKLLLESIDHEGELRFNDTIPYNEQMLSVVTDTNIDIVRSAMKLFLELNMIDILDDQTIFMNEVEKMIGSETKDAARKRVARAREKAEKTLESGHCPKLSEKCPTEIEKEKEIDKEKDKEKIDLSINLPTEEKPMDRLIDSATVSDIKDQIDYKGLTERFDTDLLDTVVSCIADLYTATTAQEFNGRSYSAEFVQKRSMEINEMHIEYVLECFEEQREKVRNIRKYLKTSIFNAPDTMGAFYTNKVRADGAVW
jgi:predicted phage replisome organizer